MKSWRQSQIDTRFYSNTPRHRVFSTYFSLCKFTLYWIAPTTIGNVYSPRYYYSLAWAGLKPWKTVFIQTMYIHNIHWARVSIRVEPSSRRTCKDEYCLSEEHRRKKDQEFVLDFSRFSIIQFLRSQNKICK